MERIAESEPVDDELRAATQQFATRLRASLNKQASRLGTTVEQLCAAEDQAAGDEGLPEATLPGVSPSA